MDVCLEGLEPCGFQTEGYKYDIEPIQRALKEMAGETEHCSVSPCHYQEAHFRMGWVAFPHAHFEYLSHGMKKHVGDP